MSQNDAPTEREPAGRMFIKRPGEPPTSLTGITEEAVTGLFREGELGHLAFYVIRPNGGVDTFLALKTEPTQIVGWQAEVQVSGALVVTADDADVITYSPTGWIELQPDLKVEADE